MWRVDVNTGVVTYPSTVQRYEAADAHITGRSSKSLRLPRLSYLFTLIPAYACYS